MIVLDSFSWIEYFGEGPLASKYSRYIENANPDSHITPSIILYEVFKKLKKERGEEIALKAIAYILSYTRVIPLEERNALESADTSLREGMGMADSIIMTTANEFNAKVVTSDSDFKGRKNVIFIKE